MFAIRLTKPLPCMLGFSRHLKTIISQFFIARKCYDFSIASPMPAPQLTQFELVITFADPQCRQVTITFFALTYICSHSISAMSPISILRDVVAPLTSWAETSISTDFNSSMLPTGGRSEIVGIYTL